MTEDEAREVVAFIAATYNRPVDQAQVAGWYHAALRDVGQPEAMTVAVELLNTSEFMPTPAAFQRVRTEIARSAYVAERDALAAAERALPSGEPVTSPAEFFSAMRSMLALQRANLGKHWHGGPAPCPVCGGMSPEAIARQRIELGT